jgi:hypothetical protein
MQFVHRGSRTVRTECVSRLLNAVLDQIGQLIVPELAVCASLKASERPLPRLFAHQVVAIDLHDLVEHLNRNVVDVTQIWEDGSDNILHPLVVCSTQSGVPVVQDCKLDGDVAAGTPLDTVPTLLDLFPEVKRPFGVGAWCVEDCCNVVLEYD